MEDLSSLDNVENEYYVSDSLDFMRRNNSNRLFFPILMKLYKSQIEQTLLSV